MEESSSGIITMDSIVGSDKFSNLTCIATTSHAHLYKAQRFGRSFLLKSLPPDCRAQFFFESLLRKEFELSMLMLHPNIVHTYGFESVEGLGNVIVMEYVDGLTLDDWLSSNPSKEERERVVDQLLEAVAYIHSLQVIHRDLKPSNVMVTRNGSNVKILDFGFSDSDSHVIFKQPAGTLKYMAPEQKIPNRLIDLRADIYSLGKIIEAVFPDSSRSIVEKCCAENPEDRYPNVQQLQSAFHKRRLGWQWAVLALIPFLSLLAYLLWPGEEVVVLQEPEEQTHEKIELVSVEQPTDTIVGQEMPQEPDRKKSFKKQADARPELTVENLIESSTEENPIESLTVESPIESSTEESTAESSTGEIDRIAKIKEDESRFSKAAEQEFCEAYRRNRCFEIARMELTYTHARLCIAFYRYPVNSNLTKEEYTFFYPYFDHINESYRSYVQKVDSLPTISKLYKSGVIDEAERDSLRARYDIVTEKVKTLTDTLLFWNSKFSQWSIQ